jgi:hypothetical protein
MAYLSSTKFVGDRGTYKSLKGHLKKAKKDIIFELLFNHEPPH